MKIEAKTYSLCLDFVDMDGASLLSNDPAFGVELKEGKVIYSDRLGSGGRLC